MKFFITIAISFFLFSCVKPSHNNPEEICRESLEKIDESVYKNPERALDSLYVIRKTHPGIFNDTSGNFNAGINAYMNLIYATATEQHYGFFNNDSVIKLSLDWYSKRSDKYNLCRSLLYNSIALYNKDRYDSVAYQSIIRAETLYHESGDNDHNLGAKLYLNLGKQYRANSNPVLAKVSLEKSLVLADKVQNINTIYYARLQLFGLFLSSRKYSEALNAISLFADADNIPSHVEYNLYMSMYNYYSAKRDPKIALEYLNKITYMDTSGMSFEINYSKIYYLMSMQYNMIGESDSSFIYSKAAVESVKDTSLTDSHFYFRNLADKYQQQEKHKDASTYYRKAHYAYLLAYTKFAQKKAIELETKFNFKKQEELINKLESSRRTMTFISIALIVSLSAAAYYYLSKSRKNEKQLTKLTFEHNKLNQNYNVKWLESELLRYSSASVAKMTDNIVLEAGRIRKISKDSYDNLNTIVDNTNSAARSYISEIANSDNFKNYYGHILELSVMTDFEKLIYVLNEEGYSNNDIANFLNSSHSSIRAVKGKIHKKIQKNGAES